MKSLIGLIDSVLRRCTPDPFVIAIILTAITFLLAVTQTESSPNQAIQIWGNGLWGLAAFTLKMAMILLGGFVVATSPPVQKAFAALIGCIRGSVQAVLFCTIASLLASWVNWGFGLVVGGVVALEVSKRVPKAPFRVLVASSYSGFLIWHAGLSGSIPLSLNTADDKITIANVGDTIPLSETMFGSVNLIALASIILLLPIVNLCLLRIVGENEAGTTQLVDIPKETLPSIELPSLPWIERSFLVSMVLGAMGGCYFLSIVIAGKFSLNLDSVMSIFFLLGLVLHGSPSSFLGSVEKAVPKIGPILIQYPLYAGIMALLKETGLASQMSEFFVANASRESLPLLTFYSAGLVNLFVPSGGGQWAIQAPIVLPAAEQLGADLNKTVMAVAWGDAWTNMLQPFWAVPLLAIAGMKIKDIIGLLLVIFLSSGIVLSLVFWFA
jgi:short-chain fatty acids transporter